MTSTDNNAVLTAINAAGAVNGNGDSTGVAGALKWSGTRNGYLRKKRRRVKQGDNWNVIEVDELIVRGRLPVIPTTGDDRTGDRITVIDHRGAAETKTYRVVDLANFAIGSPVDSVRMQLADEQ